MPSPSQNIPWTQLDLTTLRQHLLDLLCQLAYKEGDFILSSGQKSTYYINGKQVTLHPEGAVAMARIMLAMLPDDTDAVAGLTLGADPIVSAVSVVSVYEGRFSKGDAPRTIPALIIRKEAKGHGTQAYIEGAQLKPQAKVVVLEDVVTTGQSALKAVERLREAGYRVDRVITLVDRLQGGAECYAAAGLKFDAVFTIPDLQARYQELRFES
jgi:orotate phosphoribosyltransferase